MGVKRATVWTLEDGRSRRDRFEISSRSRRDRFEISSRSLRDRFEIAERSRRDQSPSTEMVWSYSTWGDNHGTWSAPNGRGWHAYPVRTVRGALGTSRPAPPVTYAAREAGTRSPSVRHGGPRGVRVSRVLDGRDDARDELEEEEEVLLDAHLVRGRVRVRVMLMVMVMGMFRVRVRVRVRVRGRGRG